MCGGPMIATRDFGPCAAHAAEEIIRSCQQELPYSLSSDQVINYKGCDPPDTTSLVEKVKGVQASNPNYRPRSFRHKNGVGGTFRHRYQALLHVRQIGGVSELSEQLTDSRGIAEPSCSHGVLHVDLTLNGRHRRQPNAA
jgi:hypothetical protein